MKSQLSMQEILVVNNWLQENKANLSGKSYKDATRRINSELNASFSTTNIISVAKAAGITWIGHTPRVDVQPTDLSNRLYKLERVVAALCNSLGHPHSIND